MKTLKVGGILIIMAVLSACEATSPAPRPSQLAFDFWGKATTLRPGFGAYTYVILPGIDSKRDIRMLTGLLARAVVSTDVRNSAAGNFSLAAIPVINVDEALKAQRNQELSEANRADRIIKLYDSERAKILWQWACSNMGTKVGCGGGAPMILASDKPLWIKEFTVIAKPGTRIALVGCKCETEEGVSEVVTKILDPDYGRKGIAFPDGPSWIAILVGGVPITEKEL